MFSKEQNSLQKKIIFCYHISLDQPLLINNNPISKLISNYSELLYILESKEKDIFKFIYFNKSNIHKIVCKPEEEIKIKIKNNNKIKLSEIFYLDLILQKIKLIYSIDYIIEINRIKNNLEDNEWLKKLIISKIIFQLINNYKESDEYKNKDSKILEMISEENNKKQLKECQKLYSSMSADLIENSSINEFYTRIIIDLIKSNKFENIENNIIYNIIEKIELESISITKTMFDELSKVLDINDDYIKNYIILKKDDLFDNKKINFYFFLLKYVFKHSFYIYQIPLLLKTRRIIINLIKNNFNQLYIFNSYNYKKKIEYIIKILTNSEYYYKKYIQFSVEPLRIILFYYKHFLFESKREDINIIEEIIKTKKNIANKNYLEDLDIAKEMEIKFPVIKYLFDLKRLTDNIPVNENEFKNCIEGWEKIEQMIKTKKIKKMSKNNKIPLINYFHDINNKEIILKIFGQDSYDYFIKENSKLLDVNKYRDDLAKIKELNNVNNNDSEITEETSTEKNTINEIKFKNCKNENRFLTEKEIIKEVRIKLYRDFKNNNNFLFLNKASKFQILDYIKKLEKYDNTVEYIKELHNGFFISGLFFISRGYGEKELYFTLNIYNEFYEKIVWLEGLKDLAYNVYEINDEENEDIVQIIVCVNQVIYNIEMNVNQNSVNIKKGYTYNCCKIFLKMEGNNCIIAGEKGAIISNYIFNEKEEDNWSNEITNLSIKDGIIINGYIVALKSNSVCPIRGKDKIIFYNCKTKNIFKEIEGYSFTISSCGLCLMPRKEIESHNKRLLCACKKYSSQQKNGILLVNIKNFEEKEYFFPTHNYEVSCFCPILIVDNKNPKDGDITKKENIKIIDTDYFFVGGFDEEKRQGLIKLFKLEFNECIKDKIIFIQDIIINCKNFEGFESNISCIIQSKITGNIYVKCLDGNVYLFSPPNIDYYLKK